MKEKRPDKNSIGVLSWIINVILLSAFWPVGVVLLILRLNGNDVLSSLLMRIFTRVENQHSQSSGHTGGTSAYTGGQQSQASAHFEHYMPQSNSSSRSRAERAGYTAPPPQYTQTQQTQQAQQAQHTQQPQAQAQAPEKQEKQKDPVARIGKGRTVLIIFGWVLLALGILTVFEPLTTGALWRVLESLAVALGGAGMLVASWKKGKKEQDYQNCVKVVGDKASFDLNSLAAALGKKPKDLEKDLDDMVDRGYFGDAAYFDKARDLLIIDPAKAEVQLKKAAAESAEGKDQYQLLLMELDRSVQRIRDPGMQQKALKIRGLSSSIFAAVREEPEKRNKIGTFLNYYFPQTLKLLNSYGDIESKDYQGENLSKTRERIEGAADLLIDAYQRQLDALYLSTSMDVDSDIDVLETMLKRDGLSGGDFSAFGEGEGRQQGGV